MGVIRVVWGTATGPTAMASYDAALGAANVHDYNLVAVSSVVPADATIEVVGTAPDLGPPGERLTVVEGRATVAPSTDGESDDDVDAGADAPETAAAGLGWSREPDGPGIFYEAAGTDPDAVAERVETGLDNGRRLREWDFADDGRRVVATDVDPESFTTAVVLAVYGESVPLF